MNSDEIKYFFIKRKVDNFATKKIPFNELPNFELDDNDTLCYDDGKDNWMVFKDFYIQEELIYDQDEIPHFEIYIDSPSVSLTNEIIENTNHVETDQNEIPILFQHPVKKTKELQFYLLGGLILVISAFWINWYFHKNNQNNRMSGMDGTTKVIQQKMEKLLLDGDTLTDRDGYFPIAIQKFSEVRKLMDSDENLNIKIVTEYILKYNVKGDSLCAKSKEKVIQDIAEEFYLYAAKLSKDNPKKCK